MKNPRERKDSRPVTTREPKQVIIPGHSACANSLLMKGTLLSPDEQNWQHPF